MNPLAAYLFASFVNAFDDNALKTLIILFALRTAEGGSGETVVSAASALFTIPFLLFATSAGRTADRFSKRTVFVTLQALAALTMLLGAAAFFVGSVPLALAALFAAGAQSAYYSPAKYGILPEALPEEDLSKANGYVEAATFLAIVFGTAYGGLSLEVFDGNPVPPALLLALLAGVAWFAARFVWRVPPARSAGPDTGRPASVLSDLGRYLRDRRLGPALAGLVFFFFLAGTVQMALLLFAKRTLFAGLPGPVAEGRTGILLAILATGIGAGSLAAGRLSAGRVEVGLVPIGFLGAAAGLCDLAASRTPLRAGADLFAAGFFGGWICVPLLAAVQAWSPKAEKGGTLAASNFLSFGAVLLASAVFYGFGRAEVPMRGVFLFLGVATIVLGVALCLWLAELVVRFVGWTLVHTVYRIRAIGVETVPDAGGAVLVANHVSFVDALLVSATLPRRVRFVMHRQYYDRPALRWFCKMMGAIPIRPGDRKDVERALREATEAARAGELVCIFPEGRITRHGVLGPFARGFEHIARDAGVPVVPLYLDEVWGSVFSYRAPARRFLGVPLPRRLPYPVTIAYGRPLPGDAPAWKARQAVAEAGAAAFSARVRERGGLGRGLLDAARRRPGALAAADSAGRSLSFARFSAAAAALSRAIARDLDGPFVPIVLPPCVPAALANAAAVLAGKAPVNLNFTASREAVAEAVRRLGAQKVLTDSRFLEKVSFDPAAFGLEPVEVAPLLEGLSRVRVLFYEASVRFLPAALSRRILGVADAPADATATVLFSSGSTGIPKGVVLTHANIRANVEGIAEVLDAREGDRMLGALPFFHAFGFTGTLWLPLLAGFAALYHPGPLDPKGLERLSAKHGATILLTTPTFARGYLKRIPPEAFARLRLAFAGAEALPADLARAWREKYGSPLLEGYGATECAPVVAVNLPDRPRPGTVGFPLPGLAVRFTDPETGAERDPCEGGMLEVKGPSVFREYLGMPEKTAEVLRDGWYRTGDMAVMEKDGAIRLVGRLSRFSKIGGEMVPHERVETALREAFPDRGIVVLGKKDDAGERLVVLHEGPIDPKEAAAALRAKGLPNLWIPKPADFIAVRAIPLLGSGKADLAACRRLVE